MAGVLIFIAFTAVITVTAVNLERFSIVGHTVAVAYPWRLTDPTFVSHLTAWLGYLLRHTSFMLVFLLYLGIAGLRKLVKRNHPMLKADTD